MEAKQGNVRVVMFPWLAHGHVFPFLELAKGLAKKHFHIYFCSTAINLDSVKNSLILDSSYNDGVVIELVELRLPSLPELPPHYHTTKNIPLHLMPTLMEAFQASGPAFSDIVTEIKPDLVVYDVMQPWSAKIAASRGIPCVFFATSGAATFALGHHFHTHKSWDSFPFEAMFLREHERKGMRAAGQSIRVRDAGEGFAYGAFDLSNDVVLMKTCRGVEGKYVDYFSSLCGRKILPTGPLITFASFGLLGSPRGARSPWRTPCRKVSSRGWERGGLVVRGWAPQAAILAHRSVGGFMSHCGWSSIMESLYFGVPVVALPLKLDQPMNATMVVEAGAGVEVARDNNGEFDGKSVAEAVREVVVEERFRCRAREMSEKMRAEGEEALDEMAKELKRICTMD